MEPVALLFSYGTLRQRDVQRAVFGRMLNGSPDTLPGFTLEIVRIVDAAVIATSGSDEHPILRRGAGSASVAGVALEITPADLPAADAYEVADYVRTVVTLGSGKRAYVYVAREDGQDPSG